MQATAASSARQRRLRLAVLAVGVSLVHLWLADHSLPSRLGDGAADHPLRRIEVAFVRELAPQAPAAVPKPASPKPRLARLPSSPGPAASAAAKAAAKPEVPADLAAAASTPQERNLPIEAAPPIDLGAIEPTPTALPALAEPPAAVVATAPALEWPPSTRLSYTLSGNYRGPVHGKAQVEWLRSGTRYQVHMDVSVGPSFAPLMARRVSSEGEITAQGLHPSRYEEVTHVALRDPRRLTVMLDADQIRLPSGQTLPRPPGVQDSASQFVQLTWLFTMQPELLQAGRRVELPLALPRTLETWTYDVLETETLDTPAGAVPAVHVKPRRPARAGNDLVAEFWAAPSLQYLPVRIVIRQDAETYIDLLIEQLPQQAEAGR